LSWWILLLWWQIDRTLFARLERARFKANPYNLLGDDGRPLAEKNCWLVRWHNPFLASASAIDRCGLLDLTSTDEVPVRELEPNRYWFEKPAALSSKDDAKRPNEAQVSLVRDIVKNDPDIPQAEIQKHLRKQNGSGIRAATLTVILDDLRSEGVYEGPAKPRANSN
jgi:hypothetical protein